MEMYRANQNENVRYLEDMWEREAATMFRLDSQDEDINQVKRGVLKVFDMDM